jgi:hypothetical protein
MILTPVIPQKSSFRQTTKHWSVTLKEYEQTEVDWWHYFPLHPYESSFLSVMASPVATPQSHTIQNTLAVNQEVLPLSRGTDKAKTITYGIRYNLQGRAYWFFSTKGMCYWFQIWRDSFQNQLREAGTQLPLVWFVLLIKSFQDSLCHYSTLNWLRGKENCKMTHWSLQSNNMCLLFSRQIQPLNPEATISDWFSEQFRLRKQTTNKIYPH